jgi:hypothetical protein
MQEEKTNNYGDGLLYNSGCKYFSEEGLGRGDGEVSGIAGGNGFGTGYGSLFNGGEGNGCLIHFHPRSVYGDRSGRGFGHGISFSFRIL